MTAISKKTTCQIITEGIAGTENQCIGVAEALGLQAEITRIKLNFPWNYLLPYFPFEHESCFSPKISKPYPDILIASGRKSVAASRYIKKKSGGKTFTVQIQSPHVSPDYFDLVVVPEHDKLRGSNVITTIAAPNRITGEKLVQAKSKFAFLEKIKSPRVAVIIGGKSKSYSLEPFDAQSIISKINKLDAGIMMTVSRRTPDNSRKVFESCFKENGGYFWNGEGENPYFGFLAWADYILVTADSSSMLSEAATTGKPVYMIDLKGGSAKFDRLHSNLIKTGALRKFEGVLEHWKYEPLNDAMTVANEIKKRFKADQR